MTAFEWTREQRERLGTLQDMDARQLANGNDTEQNPVSADTCREWREQVKDGTKPINLKGSGFSESAIRKHVKGNCTHDPEIVGTAAMYMGGGIWTEGYE